MPVSKGLQHEYIKRYLLKQWVVPVLEGDNEAQSHCDWPVPR